MNLSVGQIRQGMWRSPHTGTVHLILEGGRAMCGQLKKAKWENSPGPKLTCGGCLSALEAALQAAEESEAASAPSGDGVAP